MTTTRTAMYVATACHSSLRSQHVAETAKANLRKQRLRPASATTTTVDPAEPTTTEETTTTSAIEELPDTTVDTEPATTETTAAGTGDRFLPDDLGRRVDSVSGVDTPGEIVELLGNVWVFVPSEPDPNDASVIPPLPEDREIPDWLRLRPGSHLRTDHSGPSTR